MTEIHVCYGTNRRYTVRVRELGRRRYKVFEERKTFEEAFRDLYCRFDVALHKRGDVIMTADYYDGVQIVELVKP